MNLFRSRGLIQAVQVQEIDSQGLYTMPSHNGQDASSEELAPEALEDEENGGLNKTVATVVVVAVGAALFEAALLPGIAIGVAAVAAPKYFPKIAGALNPLFKSTVRGTYKFARKSKEMFAEAHEQVNDIVAEVKAEDEAQAKEAAAQDPHAG